MTDIEIGIMVKNMAREMVTAINVDAQFKAGAIFTYKPNREQVKIIKPLDWDTERFIVEFKNGERTTASKKDLR